MRAGSDPRPELGWGHRAVLAFVAVAGSASFGWALLFGTDEARELAVAVAVAAGLSWPVFGLALLAVTGCRPSLLAWVDACLWTMAPGIAVLAVAGLVALVAGGGTTLVLVAVAASNVTMLAVFLRQAHPLGLAMWKAVALWLVVLDGFFAVVVWWWLR